MYHYTYLLIFSNGKKYIGMRSSKLEPHFDTAYLGNGKALPKSRNHLNVRKEILNVFTSREEAVKAEYEYIVQHNCVNSDEFYNLRYKTFDKHGMSAHNKGKKVTEYKARPVFTERYGNGKRSKAMLLADEIRREKCKGKNALKGHKGTDNCAFTPWYYITPDGDYVEVHDKTKEEMAEILGFTIRQLTHGFHKTNINKKATSLPRKGWTFGNLHKRA